MKWTTPFGILGEMHNTLWYPRWNRQHPVISKVKLKTLGDIQGEMDYTLWYPRWNGQHPVISKVKWKTPCDILSEMDNTLWHSRWNGQHSVTSKVTPCHQMNHAMSNAEIQCQTICIYVVILLTFGASALHMVFVDLKVLDLASNRFRYKPPPKALFSNLWDFLW